MDIEARLAALEREVARLKAMLTTAETELPEIPDSLCSPEFISAWEEWLAYRRKRKPAVTPLSAKKAFKALEVVGVAAAVECIDLAIANGHQGLYPKAPKNGKPLPLLMNAAPDILASFKDTSPFKRWFRDHTSYFPSVKAWLEKKPEGERLAILRAWQHTVTGFTDSQLTGATLILNQRKESVPFDRHASEVARIAREEANKHDRLVARTACQQCQGRGTVKVPHSAHDRVRLQEKIDAAGTSMVRKMLQTSLEQGWSWEDCECRKVVR